jgi:hypothetical protein
MSVRRSSGRHGCLLDPRRVPLRNRAGDKPLARGGAPPKEVAACAGHTSVSFTLDRYGHLHPESDATLRDRLDVLCSASERDQAPPWSTSSASARGPSAVPERGERRRPMTDDALSCDVGGGGEEIEPLASSVRVVAADRCADRRFCRLRGTVRDEVRRSDAGPLRRIRRSRRLGVAKGSPLPMSADDPCPWGCLLAGRWSQSPPNR